MNTKEHVLITKLAYRLANIGNCETDDKKLASIIAGAKFNDARYYSTVGFVIKYLNHGDEFINESHRGSLQSLHAMDSTGSAKENYIQQLAYAKFCMDVINNTEANGQKVQDILFYEYVKNSDSVLKKLFYPIFMNHSKYASMTIKEFFIGRDRSLDAGFVALGSLAHLLEDSFSNSHSQRTGNILLEKFDIVQAIQNPQIAEEFLSNPNKILASITPVLLHQNYNEQFSIGPLGKHKHGDIFVKNKKSQTNDANIFVTQGAMQALLSVGYLFKKVSEGNSLKAITFIEKVLKVDNNALILDKINQRRKNSENAESLNKLADQSDAFAGLDFGKHSYSFTKGGRQYERTFESAYICYGKDKEWMKHEKNPTIKKLLVKYNSLLNEETYNKIFTAEQLFTQYAKQAELMIEIFTSNSANKEIRERLSNHAMELLAHIASLIRQCEDNESENIAKLKQLRSTLVGSMNNAFTK